MALFRRPRLELGAPARSTPLEELELLAVDMETTGLNPRRDRIVSVGWVPVCGRVIDLAGAGYHVVRGAEVASRPPSTCLPTTSWLAARPKTRSWSLF